MARSSQGLRRVSPGVLQGPTQVPGVLRIGRPANDNFRPRSAALRVVLLALAAAALLIAAVNWLS
ncbi:MAG: hypothetical protein AB7F22_01505 [Reyranella sp.]|uniref:hypothetical protein n=1 Tax=Reyranella sp. TaxID=1929291 RepID=UPI003D1344C4